MGVYDDIINGSFNTLGPSASSGWTAPTYQPGMMGRGLPTDRLAPGFAAPPNPSPGSGMTPAQVAAAQMGIYGSPSYAGGPATASAYAPTGSASQMEDALIAAGVKPGVPMSQQGATQVSAQMLPRQQNGGLLEMIFGPSKNGMRGLPGMMGGPNQGGLLQMLFGQNNTRGLPRVPGMSSAQAYAAKNTASRDAARAAVGKAPLYQDPNGGAHSDYGGTGAGSEHPFFSSGF